MPSAVKRMRDAIVSLDFHKEIVYRQIGAKGQLALLQCMDHRRFGPDLLDMCYTACGAIDGFVHGCETLSAVHASGVALMQEGCVVSDRRGNPINVELDVKARMSIVAAGTKELHAELLAALNAG
jgi:fructose-1,6-bisphosphatase/inositol monophosphatase family enzyme